MCSRTQDLSTLATLRSSVSPLEAVQEARDVPSTDGTELPGLPHFHLLDHESHGRLYLEALEEEIEQLMRGAERAIRREQRREIVAVDWSIVRPNSIRV